MPKAIFIADAHLRPDDDLTRLVQFIQAREAQGYQVVLGGDTFEGFLHRPFHIEAFKNCLILIGNHEHFWMQCLFDMYGRDHVRNYTWVGNIYLTHGQKFDPNQDSEFEIALAWAMFLIYSRDPNDPVLQYFYNEIMTVHRTNADIIAGLQKAGIERAVTGHSHLPHAGMDGGLEYYNPGSWRDHPMCVVIEESGVIHLEEA